MDKEQVPFFNAFTEDPETRQIFAELFDIRADNFAPLDTTNLRKVARDRIVAELPALITRGAVGTTKATIVATPPEPDGAETMTEGADPTPLSD